MKDKAKTKEQLIDELAGLRQRVTELGASGIKRKQAEEREKGLAKFPSENPNPVLRVAKNGAILYANEASQPLLNVWGSKAGQLLPEYWCKIVLDILSSGSSKNTEVECGNRVLSLTFAPIVDAGYVNVYGLDITERKRVEEALRESEERYRALVNLGGGVGEAIIMRQDTGQGEGIHTFVSDEWPRITGYSRKELLGMSFFDLLHPKHREASLKRYKRRMGGEVVSGLYEMSIISKDGTEVPVELTSAYTTYKGERANVAFIRDITERKQAGVALRKSEKQASTAIEIARALTFNYDIATGKIEWGGAIEEITGYTREEFAKVDFDGWAERIHPDDGDSILLILQEAMGKDRATAEYRFKTKKGYVILSSISLTEKEDDKAVRLIGILQDITERKEAEGREKELQQELNLSSRLASVGELAAGVAHEINNPLTGILGYSERLLRKSTDKEISRGLEKIHNEAQRASKVVQNLRTFARRREPKKEYSGANNIVRRALELRAYELKTGNIEVVTDLTPRLPKAMVDFYQIQEVFLNIILNAEQAMTEANGEGKLSIKTRRVGGYIRASFTDDGPGIPADQLDKVFDPFFTTRGETGGTGLGLSVCHGIVTEHGGKIYAKSKPWKGTTFFVELPLVTEGEVNTSLNTG